MCFVSRKMPPSLAELLGKSGAWNRLYKILDPMFRRSFSDSVSVQRAFVFGAPRCPESALACRVSFRRSVPSWHNGLMMPGDHRAQLATQISFAHGLIGSWLPPAHISSSLHSQLHLRSRENQHPKQPAKKPDFPASLAHASSMSRPLTSAFAPDVCCPRPLPLSAAFVVPLRCWTPVRVQLEPGAHLGPRQHKQHQLRSRRTPATSHRTSTLPKASRPLGRLAGPWDISLGSRR